VSKPDHARILLVIDSRPSMSASERAEWTKVRVQIFDDEARLVALGPPGSRALVELPAGPHVLAAAAHWRVGRAHAGCVGALRADLAPGHLYAARVFVGPHARLEGALPLRDFQCARVEFERVGAAEVLGVASGDPARLASLEPSSVEDLDYAELVTGAAKLRTIVDDHQHAIPRGLRFIGYRPSAAPSWSASRSSLSTGDGVPIEEVTRSSP
jgi:hypothetical protein